MGVAFDGPGTPPTSVKLVFSGQGIFPERTVAVTGPGTQYAFNLPTGVYTNVDASFSQAAASDAFFLSGATALVRELPRPLPLLTPREFRADDLFLEAVRGWRCRSPTAPAALPPAARLAQPGRPGQHRLRA